MREAVVGPVKIESFGPRELAEVHTCNQCSNPEAAMVFQVCPVHTLDDVEGIWVSNDVGWRFTCERADHVPSGPYTWLSAPAPPAGMSHSGVAEELGLGVEIPAVLKEFDGRWIEYGIFERAYAVSHPKDWKFLIDRYGHSAIAPKQYTASAFLAATLGNLERAGVVAFHSGPATGRWSYNGTISYWALPPASDWSKRLSWAASELTVEYVPNQSEH